MEKTERWNPWLHGAPKPTASATAAVARASNVDPLLSEIVGQPDEPTPPAPATDDFLTELEERRVHGTSAAQRGGQKALSLDEVRTSLKTMREKIGDPRYERVVKEIFPKLLKSAEIFLPEDSVTTKFLRAAVTKDKAGMQEAIRILDAPVIQ